MKIAFITALPYGSVANQMYKIADAATNSGHTCYTFSKPIIGFENKRNNHFFIGTTFSVKLHSLAASVTGYHGLFSVFATLNLIKRLKKINPDVLMLLNLHGWFINLPLLFNYIKRNNIKTVWRFSDCWPFTGHCTGFSTVKCEKWKKECYDCPQYGVYPQAKVDRSKNLFRLKRKWFNDIKELTIVSQTKFMRNQIEQSFLKKHTIKVLYNGVDLEQFKPTKSDFRSRYDIKDKFIVLGVASDWSERKGLDVMIELSKRLDERFQVVIVGFLKDTLENTNIIAIPAQKADILREIYTEADVFANPSREDTFANVNLEALACGTPVVMFNTDGTPEGLDETCGIVVDKDDIDEMQKQIETVCINQLFSRDNCIKRAELFEKRKRTMEYVNLFEEIVKDKNDKKSN